MMLLATLVVFIFLLILSLPIAFSLGIAAIAGLAVGELPMQMIPSGLVSGSQNWILLAVPSFIFAGSVMERCGIAQALVTLARALIGWVRGGLGMSVVVSAYFFSDLSGSTMADVSALGTTLTKPLVRAGYRRVDAASLIASGTAMGMLVPPAIFMIVLGEVTNTSVVALFLAGFIPALIVALCLCTIIFIQAHRLGWPKDTRPSFKLLIAALRASAIPLVVPVVLVFGFYFGVFTATEAGAVVALYSIVVARFYYRNVSWRDIFQIAYESALL